MTTYNQTSLDAQLQAKLSPQTASLIESVLKDSGLFPTRGSRIQATIQGAPGELVSGTPPITVPAHSVYVFNGTPNETVDLATGGHDFIATNVAATIDDIGHTGHDTLVGGAADGTVLTVNHGNNVLYAGAGATTLNGGGGNDTMHGGLKTVMNAGTGNDKLHGDTMAGSSSSADTLIGGAGDDLLKVTSGNNSLVAGTGHNTLYGGSGLDTLDGGGHSVMYAGSGSNSIVASSGYDTIYGGSGTDTISLQNGGSSSVTGGTGSDTVNVGVTGNDTIIGGHSTSIYTSQTEANMTEIYNVKGVSEITFSGGQQLDVKDVTIHFQGGGVLKIH
ncbi:calcium-binding protein [Rhodoblastus sp.]|uniref:calcium-binding protein n=1 Tax=Rhodoblastus sp. TaxID=1962975 RepID=UPI003F9AD6D3